MDIGWHPPIDTTHLKWYNLSMEKERQTEFQRHKDEILRDYQRKINALYTLYPEFSDSRVSDASTTSARYGVTEKVRAVVESHSTEEITSKKVIEWLNIAYPGELFDSTLISNTLARLANVKKELLLITPKGQRPAIYKKPVREEEVPW